MIKLAYNKEKDNLAFMIDKVEREGVTSTGIIEKYAGTLVDTNTNDKTENYKVSVLGFDSNWKEVPVSICNLINDVHNQSKSATPTTSAQEITPDAGYTGLDKVTIAATPLDEAQTATLSVAEDVTISPSTGKVGLVSVTVPKVTASIDANITAGNIKKDVTILGVTGSLEIPAQRPCIPIVGSTAASNPQGALSSLIPAYVKQVIMQLDYWDYYPRGGIPMIFMDETEENVVYGTLSTTYDDTWRVTVNDTVYVVTYSNEGGTESITVTVENNS